MDLLGQKDTLRDLRIPGTQLEDKALIEKLKSSWGLVDMLRKAIPTFFSSSADRPPPSFITPEQMPTFERLQKHTVRYFAVSDSVCIWVPLDAGPSQMGGVHQMMLALAAAILEFLSLGHALRGGVGLGVASDSIPPCIYGPALNEALHLEAHVAGYPRIVVAEGVADLLRSFAGLLGDSIEIRFQRQMAELTQRLLTRDEDDALIVDYLGREARDTFSQPGAGFDFDGACNRIRTFFESQLKMWEAKHCTELRDRYIAALHYVDSRIVGIPRTR